MAGFRTLDDFDLHGKTVLVRADFNVPVEAGKVTDITRIERALPTIQAISGAGGKTVILSHFGRPEGKPDPRFSLATVLPALNQALGRKAIFVDTDWNDIAAAKQAIADAEPSAVILLQNTRFHPGETKNDADLAARMASLGDIYVNDAFSAAHRAHASTEAIAHLLPAAAGRAMQAELEALEAGLGHPKKPVIAIVGGAKVSTKIAVLEHLVEKVEALVIGGGMANTFLFAEGIGIGRSLCEKDQADTARRIYDRAAGLNCAIILPVDGVVAWHLEAGAPSRVYGIEAIDGDGMVVDVGPHSVDRIKGAIDEAATLVWNGPLGIFEMPPFDTATLEIARHAAARTKAGKLVSVAGGGDTVAALARAGVGEEFTYVSAAGGAFLEWMEGRPLPGVEALKPQ
jgi:phosphoglycerate kinase